jgi:hypothetical protein
VTSGLDQSRHKKNTMILAGTVGVLLIAVVVLVVVLLTRSDANSRAIIVTPPGPPAMAPPIRPGQPVPPAPPPPVAGVQPSGISDSLIYPGSERTMDMTTGEGKLVSLRTTDPVDKVAEWYASKTGSMKVVRIPGNNAILKGNGMSIFITAVGQETNILIKQGGDE